MEALQQNEILKYLKILPLSLTLDNFFFLIDQNLKKILKLQPLNYNKKNL